MAARPSLEAFRATVEHRPHDQFLYGFSCTPDLDRRLRGHLGLGPGDSYEDHFEMPALAGIGLRPPGDGQGPDFTRYFEDLEIPGDAFINRNGVLEIPGSKYHFTRYVSPLRNAESLEDIEDFPYPSVEGYTDDHMAEEVERAHGRGLATVTGIGHMYETAWQIRGYEEFLRDMVLNPEICEYLLERLCERNVKIATAAARAGVDCISFGDDVANEETLMFSRSLWREFMKPRWARVIAAARRIKPDIEVDYHSDGNVMDLIPEFIEIGITILNPIQPECMDPVEVKGLYGSDLVLKGTIGTQTTMPFGSPEEVRRVVRERKERLGYDGALILRPTHVLEPEVPIENILAFVDSCRRDGP